MNAIGKVIKTEGKTATVVSERSSACAACHNCEAHGACHAELIFGNQTEQVSIVAYNDVGANVGDAVLLESSTAKTLAVSFFIFVFPLILTVLLYFLFIAFFENIIGIMPIVLIITFFVLFVVSSYFANAYVKKRTAIHIVRVLEEC